MKTTWFGQFITHPVMQLVAFSVILIPGQVFSAPYLWYVRYGSSDGQLFALIGLVAIIITLISIFYQRSLLQLSGLSGMWLSLIILYAQSNDKAGLFQNLTTLLTLLLFFVVSVVVVLKHIRWKSS